MNIIVINKFRFKKHSGIRINIMRPTVLGNPYPMDDNNTKEDVLELYEDWLRKKLLDGESQQSIEINRIVNIIRLNPNSTILLECCCAPFKCHGDIIKKIIMELIANGR